MTARRVVSPPPSGHPSAGRRAHADLGEAVRPRRELPRDHPREFRTALAKPEELLAVVRRVLPSPP
ncbi:hypothetical protein [Streptosporangium oxazolinicum]|uniref:hypothetical protein n=1 Tax=Streptosporangium oxazolinicum TaxID=909287 RepID=UPI0031E64C68